MKLPFIKDNTKDVEKRKLHKVIQEQAWIITKKFPMGRCTSKDVDKLEKLYKTYYEKYPDVKGQANADRRIAQLRGLIK